MKSVRITSTGSLAAIAVVLSGLLVSPQAKAQNAAAAYAAYNAGYLVQSGGKTYYATTLTSKGTTESKMYTSANDIEVAEDAYQYSRSQADQSIVTALLDRYLVANGTDWTYDGWNDDIGWMCNIFIRGYQFTGQANYLTVAENNWNMAYNRGWDNVAHGGIWENTSKPNKDALSNNNFIFEAVSLYQLSGDSTYLTKGEAIYNWMRTYMVNDTNSNNSRGVPGQVNQGINPDGSLLTGDNLYNNGTWVKAANTLYRITGIQMYHDDALLTITHVINTEPILHSTAECCGNQWAYWFTQGLSEFATDNNQWGTYLSFMQNNANTAWSHRCSLNLTWNDWRNPTDCSAKSDAMEMGSAAEIWQNLPPPSLSLSGTWELQNVYSGLAVSVTGASTTKGATVDQEAFVSGAKQMLWTLVPTSGGFYQIKNVNSGLVLEVAGQSVLGSAQIHQWTAQSMIPGNDQWMPFKNSDGTYSFYNLNSYLALNDPGQSKTSGTVLDQWFANSSTSEEFNLIAH